MDTATMLQTDRLLLRPLTTRDAEDLALYAGDPDVAGMTARIPHPYTITEAFRWVASIGPNEFVRAVVCDGSLIGVVAFSRQAEENDSAEIGYWLGKPYWGRGFATEAAGEVCRFCFECAGVRRLTSSHFIENRASRNVLLKLGFREAGRGKAWCEARQLELDAIQYDLVRRNLKRPSRR